MIIPEKQEYIEALGWIVDFCDEHPEWFGEGKPEDGAEFEWLEHARELVRAAESEA